jgi:colicin import membrane protein
MEQLKKYINVIVKLFTRLIIAAQPLGRILKKLFIYIYNLFISLIISIVQPIVTIAKKHPIAFFFAMIFHISLVFGLFYAEVERWEIPTQVSGSQQSAPTKAVTIDVEVIKTERQRLVNLEKQKKDKLASEVQRSEAAIAAQKHAEDHRQSEEKKAQEATKKKLEAKLAAIRAEKLKKEAEAKAKDAESQATEAAMKEELAEAKAKEASKKKTLAEEKTREAEAKTKEAETKAAEAAEQRTQDEAKSKEATKQELEAKLEALKAAKRQELAEEKAKAAAEQQLESETKALEAAKKEELAEAKTKEAETKAAEAAEQRTQDEAKAKEATKQELEAKLEALKAAKRQELAEEKAEAAAEQQLESETKALEATKKKEALDAELIVLKEKFEDEQNVRALITEIQDEEDADRRQMLEDILMQLKVNYIGLIAARVKDEWRYLGAEDDWGCDVHIIQSDVGDVLAVNIQDCTIDDSAKAISFKHSIERAVYKASPLPHAPDKDLFDAEILFHFRVN